MIEAMMDGAEVRSFLEDYFKVDNIFDAIDRHTSSGNAIWGWGKSIDLDKLKTGVKKDV